MLKNEVTYLLTLHLHSPEAAITCSTCRSKSTSPAHGWLIEGSCCMRYQKHTRVGERKHERAQHSLRSPRLNSILKSTMADARVGMHLPSTPTRPRRFPQDDGCGTTTAARRLPSPGLPHDDRRTTMATRHSIITITSGCERAS